ncbi:MAG: trypsin-like peptidase domain-containing protein [Planctomycetaceae bacterium]
MKRASLSSLCLLLVSVLTCELSLADQATLISRQQQLDAALKKVSPALVCVQDGLGAGSGVVVSADGIVLTASHVVETRGRQPLRLHVLFPDGKEYRADLLGMNRAADAAMLKIREAPPNGREFPHVKLGESSKLERGDWCFALGHPGGFKPDRPAPVRLGRVLSVGDLTVVSDCAIVLGDSGGPLFDMNGQVIGIHSMITEVIVENRHVAVDVFRRDGDRMEKGESWGRLEARDNDLAETGFMGVTLRWRSFTAEVAHVIRDSPADRAGIRSGDVLLRIADQRFADPLGLSTLLNHLDENRQTTVLVDRIGREITLNMTTGRRPSREELMARTDRVTAIDDDHLNELEQQLTSLRRVGPFEKRSIEEMARFEPVLAGAERSVVEFREFARTLTLGAVMSSDGYILTKASELNDAIDPECILSSGRRLKFRKVAVDRAFDLMLVKVDAKDLVPVQWSETPAPAGRIVVTTDSRGTPLLPGVISVATRKLPTATRGFLGVRLAPISRPTGVGIEGVVPGGAAESADIRKGDIVLAVNDVEVRGSADMSNRISRLPPNSKVTLKIERSGAIRYVTVDLTSRFLTDDSLLPRYQDSENLGKIVSNHNSGFPEVLEHDTDLYPNQCGGPLYDVTGKAVGLNIARSARITSYAVPASAVRTVYQSLRIKDLK